MRGGSGSLASEQNKKTGTNSIEHLVESGFGGSRVRFLVNRDNALGASFRVAIAMLIKYKKEVL